MLVVNMMIIQFHLKLDRSYCIGVMKSRKSIKEKDISNRFSTKKEVLQNK